MDTWPVRCQSPTVVPIPIVDRSAVALTRDPVAWARLGKAIRATRESQGLSRNALAVAAGVSEKSIQVAEEGRIPRARWPQSLTLIERALGWDPGNMQTILGGGSPTRMVSLGTAREAARAEGLKVGDSQEFRPPGEGHSPAPLMGAREAELTESGHLAQDTFLRQMKRYRKLKGVSVEELAERIAEVGGGQRLSLDDLRRLENGTRLLKFSDADLLAEALGTNLQWLLGSGFQSDAPDEMKVPPDDEELQAEAKAFEQRMLEIGMQVNNAMAQHSYARRRAEQARVEADMAAAALSQATARMAELERQYHYLIGRIDSLRAAKGEEQIFQVAPVYEDE
ncbi:helix-turn-helix transcriptional regulator [Streptomyces sp. NPDC017524]|uniref:helix-turn-helix transcriptional regulator n=1 Tax=Streptomyces sp. NPDC017524 TaxID=3364999 RepID=UPI0037B59F26